jgi:GT2 family glycosyltransferase/glycosyltransferase involved in cell wall biosynthesis
MPSCSIVIPVHNKASLTRQCLGALLAGPRERVAFEVIVVDDASTDQTPDLLAGWGGRIRVVTHATNTGFAGACNAGAAAAAGEYVLFLNNDTLPRPGWLEALLRYADGHPAAAVVGSKLLFPEGAIQHAGMVIAQDRYPVHIYTGFPADHPAVNKSRRFQLVTGACMLIRRALFEQVRGFDAAFVNGFEDVDLCLRLGERGHEVHYCHESVLYHLECATRDGRSKQERQNTRLYQERWAHRVQPDDLRYFLEDGLLAIDHQPLYPISFSISPLLGVVSGEGRERRADRLLEARTRQVQALLKDNIRLSVRLQEAELRAPSAPGGAAPAPAAGPGHGNGAAGGWGGWPQAWAAGGLMHRNNGSADKPFGVNLAGLLGSEKGLGEAVRATARNLRAAGIPHVLNNFVDHSSANRDATFTDFSEENPYAINLVQVNVDLLPEFLRHKGEAYLRGRYNIAFWYWELGDFPEDWEPRLRYFDEVWVGSTFSLDSVSRVASVPVLRVPPSLPERLATTGWPRSHFGLPEGAFLFLFLFDFHSSAERKNPLGVIRAFQKAFPRGGDALLVLKGSHAEDCPADLQALTEAARGLNVRFLGGVLSREETNALLSLCDCYVSLHRSEGFGLPLAEAMSLAKPVIATGYSGNLDFMTLRNSFLVRHRLVEIERDHHHYKKGSVWADPDLDHAAELMRFVYENRELAGEVGRRARQEVLHAFDPRAVGARIKERLLRVAGRKNTGPARAAPGPAMWEAV